MAVIDVVVSYRGAARALNISDEDTILPLTLASRYKQNAARVGRKLVRTGEFTNSINNPALIRSTIDEIKRQTRNNTVGAICIYGSSSGGRNALDLSVGLANETEFAFSIQYLALLDAAFFPGDTIDIPNAAEPTNIPLMNTAIQVPIAFKRENFFQVAGNHRETRLIGRDLFVSEMGGKEIHGNVPFMNPRNLTNDIRSLPNTTGKSKDDGHHGNLISKAIPTVHSEIAVILDALIPQGAQLNFKIPGVEGAGVEGAGVEGAGVEGERIHVVVSGDNLSKISRKFFGTEAHWPKIHAANRAVIGANPNLIRVGQRLVIPTLR
jgi:hypothetical protein